MKPTHFIKTWAVALLLGSLAPGALADDGHDHGDAPAASGGPALPRFAASSDTFELVGVLDGKRLALYLDHANDNSPVKDAKLELELGGIRQQVEPHGEGEFEVLLAEPPKPGVVAVTATVLAGNESDLLAGELDIHPAAHAEEAAHGLAWPRYTPWAVAAAVAGLALVAFAMRRLRLVRRVRLQQAGGVA